MKFPDFTRFLCLALICGLAGAPLCRGGLVSYNISMNTSPLIGEAAGPFSLAFQLNDGSGSSDGNNTATLSGFHFGAGGSASGSPTFIGGATGALSTQVTLTDTGFPNAFIQSFNPGIVLSFNLQETTNVDAGPTPDEFSFSILDNTGTELPTTGFIDAFLVLDITSSPTPQTFSSDSSRPPQGGGSGITMSAPQVSLATPEPGTLILFGVGLALQLLRRSLG